MKKTGKAKPKIFIVDSGSYKYDVLCGIGCTHEAMVKYAKKINKGENNIAETEAELLEHFKGSSIGRVFMLKNNQLILWVKDSPLYPDQWAILTHEIFHVVELLFEKIELPLTNQSAEAYAYQIEYYFEKIMAKIIFK